MTKNDLKLEHLAPYLPYRLKYKDIPEGYDKERTLKIETIKWCLENGKPILRPLSSMTSDEAEHFAWMCFNTQYHPEAVPVEKEEMQIELVKNDNGGLLDEDVEIYIGVSVRCFEGYIAIMKDWRIGICNEEETPASEMSPIEEIHEKLQYLFSCHFDVFGLIKRTRNRY